MIIATAGHVDHGKTSLVRVLTGVDTDRLPEERTRGMTIDLGFAYRDLGDGEPTGFVDVPGHERFVRTMVAGVSGIDAVLFVIAADDGPMPQTAEHLAILDLLGVTRGVIALSKCDRVDAARCAAVTAEIRELLAGGGLAAAPVIAVSAVTGEGLDTLREMLRSLRADLPHRDRDGSFRLAVDRSFVLKGAGRVVTGTVLAGRVTVGDNLLLAPVGTELRVRSIHAQNRAASAASAGDRCALNVTATSGRDIEPQRGDWVVASTALLGTRRCDARVRVLASEARALANRTPVHVHAGAADVTGRIVTLDSHAIAPGGEALVQVQLDRELQMVHGDRFVLRDQSAQRTVGGGSVIDPVPITRGRSREERAAYRTALERPDVEQALVAAVDALPNGMSLQRFAQAWNLDPATADALFARVPLVRVQAGDEALALAPARWTILTTAVLKALGEFHRREPGLLGASLPAVRKGLEPPLPVPLAAAVLDALREEGEILREGGTWRLRSHRPRQDPVDAALWKKVRPLLATADGKVPVLHDMLPRLGLTFAVLEAFMQRAARQGLVVKVGPRRYFLPASVDRLAEVARTLARAQAGGTFSAADFRDRAGIGRNTAIEVLEYFDRIGLTRREGERRLVLKPGTRPTGS